MPRSTISPLTAERGLLLDTHAFLWAASDPGRLGAAARTAIEGAEGRLLLSTASVWELAIKASLGKLDLADPVAELVRQQAVALRLELLPVQAAHAARVEHLPWHHRDPFDRLLAAQALAEGLPIASRDSEFDRYGVERIWD